MRKRLVNKQQKIRLFLLIVLPVILGGLLIVLWNNMSPAIPCQIRRLTGLLCPGCGMTRATNAFLHFHFIKSVLYNPAALICAVLGIGLYIEQWTVFFEKPKKILPRDKWFYIIIGIIFFVYCVLRNVPAFSFLSIA